MSVSRHLRPRDGDEQTTTNLELFFDLVYVFAVTQVSHVLLHDLGVASALKATFLLVAIWWAWNYTTWLVNWFEPRSAPVRVVLLGVMLGSLVMAAALPQAFGRHALLFALAYVAVQVGRNAAGMLLLHRPLPLRRTLERVLSWSVAAGVCWIAGGLSGGAVRTAFWIAALAIDLLGPITLYATPGLGRETTEGWSVEGGHFADRFQAFVIIALGESVVITGATASDAGLTGATVTALAVAFLQTATLWWLYFGEIAERALARMAGADDVGALARDAYTYLHLPIVAGVIVSAAGAEFVVNEPGHHPSFAQAAVLTIGPLLFLLGEVLVRLRMVRSLSSKRVVACAALLSLLLFATTLPMAAVFGLTTAVLVALAVVERITDEYGSHSRAAVDA